jgi:hypothetical protein
MAIQGVLAYFYDQIRPGTHVELDVCRWNQVVADVIWRGPQGQEYLHQCRDYPHDGIFKENTPESGKCHDCTVLPVEETMTVHFTACKKPWECRVPVPRVPNQRNKAHEYRLQHLTNVTTCGKLFHLYFKYREDVETKIAIKIGAIANKPEGDFRPKMFNGYCNASGVYIPMADLPAGFDLSTVYGF